MCTPCSVYFIQNEFDLQTPRVSQVIHSFKRLNKLHSLMFDLSAVNNLSWDQQHKLHLHFHIWFIVTSRLIRKYVSWCEASRLNYDIHVSPSQVPACVYWSCINQLLSYLYMVNTNKTTASYTIEQKWNSHNWFTTYELFECLYDLFHA